ncbi:unnamed protein product [Prorocentrum cordatum]|uniref:J domain-containing protein n=1 Tax=Prorocentrum cordatum TaxID=2364126 RepID=A0ABN9VJT4_9DINO|nr:unnamed protein product [Polarella glacialis]
MGLVGALGVQPCRALAAAPLGGAAGGSGQRGDELPRRRCALAATAPRSWTAPRPPASGARPHGGVASATRLHLALCCAPALVAGRGAARVAAGSRLPCRPARRRGCRRYRVTAEDLPVPGFLQEARGQGSVAVAVTGGPGVGKSTWINTLRRLPSAHPDAALTGVNDARLGPQMYRLWKAVVAGEGATGSGPGAGAVALGNVVDVISSGPSDWQVRPPGGATERVDAARVRGVVVDCHLWDLPGAGTPGYPQEGYVPRMGLAHFDLVVIVTASRFTEPELLLATELRRLGVPFCLIRNKVDLDTEAELESLEDCGDEATEEWREMVEERTLDRIRRSFFHGQALEGLDSTTPVYCISSRLRLRDRFDFERLEEDMEAVVCGRSSFHGNTPRSGSAAADEAFLDEGGRPDPYKVLGVPFGAGPSQIRAVARKAFLTASKVYHPDKNGGRLLEDPVARADYLRERFLSSFTLLLQGAVKFGFSLWRALLEATLQRDAAAGGRV